MSFVMVATSAAGAPLLLLSDLAEHSRHMAADNRVSLLYREEQTDEDPLTRARLSLQGTAGETGDEADRARYLRRHPAAEQFAGFGDFRLYRVAVERAHLVAGFGRITWIDAGDLWPDRPADPLAAAETDVVEHMNDDHADALDLYAHRLLGRTGDGWRMTGIDPEGIDLRRDHETARLPFETPVTDAGGAREALVKLVRQARDS